jgi:hypothetical protein
MSALPAAGEEHLMMEDASEHTLRQSAKPIGS